MVFERIKKNSKKYHFHSKKKILGGAHILNTIILIVVLGYKCNIETNVHNKFNKDNLNVGL